MSWYKEWFNSEYYLKVYSHRNEDEAKRLVKLIEKNINLKKDASVLDMACGSGRHSIVFAKRGYQVTAIDLSERLLTEAKKNAIAANVKIKFVLSDILEFNSDQRFNLAVNLFTSVGYFENDDENFAVIRKGYDLLSTRGFFVLDYFNKDFLLKNLVPTSVMSENGMKITQNRSIIGNRVVKKITIEKDGAIDQFYESVRLYSYNEMKSVLKKTGFEILKEFGDFFGCKYDRGDSQRLIFIAQK